MAPNADFWKRVSQPSPYCCWEWGGGRTGDGYGQLSFNGEHWNAHRLAYTLLVRPVPEGLTLDHLCRNPACVNPLHLEAVSQRINVRRGRGLAAANARKTHCKRGHEFNERNTWLHDGQRLCRKCRQEATRRWKEARRGA